MKYLLMIHVNETTYFARPETEAKQSFAAYQAYREALNKAGVLLAAERLRPVATATTVRNNDGKTQVMDGPYAEIKEQLGGFFMIDVPDLDAALTWAKRCPGADHGAVEVRPIWSY